MTIKEIWLSFIEKFLSILGKDSMQYKLQKYRLYGAKIGGGGVELFLQFQVQNLTLLL